MKVLSWLAGILLFLSLGFGIYFVSHLSSRAAAVRRITPQICPIIMTSDPQQASLDSIASSGVKKLPIERANRFGRVEKALVVKRWDSGLGIPIQVDMEVWRRGKKYLESLRFDGYYMATLLIPAEDN